MSLIEGNHEQDISASVEDESSLPSSDSDMCELRRVRAAEDNADGDNNNNNSAGDDTDATATTDVTKLLQETVKNQNLLLEEFEFMQQEQRYIKEKLESLQKEQEKFHIGGYKRMEQGFKKVDKCLGQMEGINEVFKEVIGIISGQRIRFLDHSQENLHEQDAQLAATSELLEDNGRRNAPVWNDSMSYNRDKRILEGNIKREVQDPWSVLPEQDLESAVASLHGSNENDMSQSASTGTGTVGVASSASGSIGSVPPQLADSNSAHGSNGFIQRYRMNRAIKTVTDLAREYYEGLPGQPSVMALERRFGSTWRSSAGERTFFHKRYVIIQRIETILREPSRFNLPLDITRRKAVRVIENLRVGNNRYNNGSPCCMTLAQLYLYFSKYMDSYDDYSLSLKNKDAPSIREIKSRQKKKTPSQLAEEHSIMT